ncbi:MAG: adenosylcobinamide-GDP ribazoletransferase [Oscillospiraceae bacterium]|jgi:adenosylcobinamide-GDP ribazoletransferase|nr:adenosylcobinamide-GDP ribazoletransferase [Oscillospiraceae bacterium]
MFNAIRLAFSMFSRVPMGNPAWNEKNMRYMMAAFPLVGAVIGALVFGWLRLTDALALPNALRALGMTLIPLAVTGGIHLDGLCDTADALASNASPERRREILKDPRAGAFGVIAIAVYLLSYYALASAFPRGDLRADAVWGLSFVFTRALSANAVLTFPGADGGTAKAFRDASAKRSRAVLCGFVFALALAAAMLTRRQTALPFADAYAAPLVAVVFFLHLKRTARVKFGGMSGDLAGWFLQRAEVWMLAAMVAARLA